jgi:DNA-binding Xre family transcriptional regulator
MVPNCNESNFATSVRALFGAFFADFEDREQGTREQAIGSRQQAGGTKEKEMLRILRETARQELERQIRPYRRALRQRRPPEGWLRAMRLATGFPVAELAQTMELSSRMIFQIERSEQNRNIRLKELEKMARALECDLVYGLVPWQRSLDDRALELVERDLWRKRFTARKTGSRV